MADRRSVDAISRRKLAIYCACVVKSAIVGTSYAIALRGAGHAVVCE